jgi:hypothetical protein
MEENKSWSDPSEDLEVVTKKIKSKISQEELFEDLMDSLTKTINSSKELIKNIVESLESTVNDEDIKTETKELFSNISIELNNTVMNIITKVKNLNLTETKSEEE